MSLRTDIFDLGGLRLSVGEGRRLDLEVAISDFQLAAERYVTDPSQMRVRLDISRTTGDGYALRLRFRARVSGPCMRCLGPAAPELEVDAREVSQPGGGDELESPYVHQGELDLHSWARDALGLALPPQILCRADCPGLCPVCGADLSTTGLEHHHAPAPDPRWAGLSELRFED